jgi:TonB family protein
MKTAALSFLIFFVSVASFAQRSSKSVVFTEKDKEAFKSHLGEIASANEIAKDLYVDEKKKPAVKKMAVNRDSLYVAVDLPAAYPGGQEALGRYIAKSIARPKSAKKGDRILVKFVVERYGEISHAHIVEGAENTELSAEALRVVRSMGYWVPARIKGIEVASYNTLTITF